MASRDNLSKTMRIEIESNPRDNWQPKVHSRTSHSPKKIITKAARLRNMPERSELKELFENTYDAAFITNFSGLITAVNIRASEFFGFSCEEMTGANIIQLIVGFNEDILKAISENLNEGRFTLLEAQCIRADNSRFHAEISTSLLQLTKKDCLCFFLRDITARRETEQSLQAANESLRVEIEERERAEEKLKDAIASLQAHDKAQTQFVSNVSHELKTPVASILYMAGNMLKGVVGPVPDRLHPYLGMIREDCTRLRRTVDDILDMSRIEAGSLVLRQVSVSFSRFVRQAVTPLTVQAEAARLQLKMTLDEDLGFVQCDPRKLERVIINIVKNAIKFNREDGAISVQTWRDPANKDWVCLCVDDTGIGIEVEHLPHLTERFYRVGEYVSGSGLGLSISKDLIERHGGELVIESPPPGQEIGTRVLVRLPSIAPPSVLLIHDSDQVLTVVAAAMVAQGYRAQTVKTGNAARDMLEKVQPDYIILDWSGDNMDGAAMIAAVQPHLQDVAILAIVGENASVAQCEILRGFNIPTVSCPFDEKTLLNSFDNILADHE